MLVALGSHAARSSRRMEPVTTTPAARGEPAMRRFMAPSCRVDRVPLGQSVRRWQLIGGKRVGVVSTMVTGDSRSPPAVDDDCKALDGGEHVNRPNSRRHDRVEPPASGPLLGLRFAASWRAAPGSAPKQRMILRKSCQMPAVWPVRHLEELLHLIEA